MSFGPKTWNWGTLKTIVKKKIECIWTVFHYQNNYYFWVIDKVINEVKQKTKTTTVINNKSVSKTHWLVPACKGTTKVIP